MAERISAMTAGTVAEMGATTTGFESSIDLATTPATRRLTAGTIAEWLRKTGFAVAIAASVSQAAIAWTFGGGSGVDNAAGDFSITAPLSTGAATPASLIFKTGTAGSTGAAVQSAITRLSFKSTAGVFNDDLAPVGAASAFETGERRVVTYGDQGGSPSQPTGWNFVQAGSFVRLRLAKSNGTAAIPTTIALNDTLGGFGFCGYDGTAWTATPHGEVSAFATEAWAVGAHGTSLQFTTTATGTTSNTTKAIIAGVGTWTLQNLSANTPQVVYSSGSLTGSNASTFWSYAGTWNTSGVATAMLVNITNTASGAGSLLLDLQASSISRFKVHATGTTIIQNNGTHQFASSLSSALNEWVAGPWLGANTSTSNTVIIPNHQGTAGIKAVIGYYNQTTAYSALEVAHVASGFGTLALMKSGGSVVYGTDPTGSATFRGTGSASLVGVVGVNNLASSSQALTIGAQSTANIGIISATGFSLTGSNATTFLNYAGTWNTSGTPTAFSLAITNTASNASSLIMGLYGGAAGATALLRVFIGGNAVLAGDWTIGATNTMGYNGSTKMTNVADAQWNLTNNAASAGIGFDFATDAVLKLRVRAQNAYATLDVLGLKASGVAGATGTSTAATGTVTIVNGIVTAFT